MEKPVNNKDVINVIKSDTTTLNNNLNSINNKNEEYIVILAQIKQ